MLNLIIEAFQYTSMRLLNIVAETLCEVYGLVSGETVEFVTYNNISGSKGLLSQAYNTFVPSKYSKDAWAALSMSDKKDLIRNHEALADYKLLVIVNKYHLVPEFIRDYKDRIGMIAFIRDDETIRFYDEEDIQEYLDKVEVEESRFYTYGVAKAIGTDSYEFTCDSKKYSINFNEYDAFTKYRDLGSLDLLKNPDNTAIAESAWRNMNYEVLTYAGGDAIPTTLVGGIEDHSEKRMCRKSFVQPACSKQLYMDERMLANEVEYLAAVKQMIESGQVPEDFFDDIDVIKCPHCSQKMRYSISTSWSTCSHCGMSIANPANVEVEYAEDGVSTEQNVANNFYTQNGYVSYDAIDPDLNPAWLGEEDAYDSYLDDEESEDEEYEDD